MTAASLESNWQMAEQTFDGPLAKENELSNKSIKKKIFTLVPFDGCNSRTFLYLTHNPVHKEMNIDKVCFHAAEPSCKIECHTGSIRSGILILNRLKM